MMPALTSWLLVLSLVFAVGAASVPVLTSALPLPSVRQESTRESLRARTDQEIARAKYFDRFGTTSIWESHRVVLGAPAQAPQPPGEQELQYEAFATDAVCRSDAVVVGRVLGRRVFLNASETFLYTNYDIAVESWIRGRREIRQPQFRMSITVSLPGGAATVGGMKLEVVAVPPLKDIETYILFLSIIEGAPSYVLEQPSVVVIEGEKVRVRRDDIRLPRELKERRIGRAQFLSDLAKSAAQCRKEVL